MYYIYIVKYVCPRILSRKRFSMPILKKDAEASSS